jgi:hypothetical protein
MPYRRQEIAATGLSLAGRMANDRHWGGGRLFSLQVHADERGRTKMFGQMQVTPMFQLSKLETVDEAVAELLEEA